MKNNQTISKQVVTYFRVSTLVQDNERQIQDVEKYCNDKEFKIVSSFEEKESGTHEVRPELTNMLNFVKTTPNIKNIVISELSRIGRSYDVINIIHRLHKLGIGLICLKEGLSSLNDDGSENSNTMLILTIMSGINTADLVTLKYRIKSGLLNSARNGHAGGSTNYPYGFTKGIDKMLIVNDAEAVTVRLIFEMSDSGKGTKVIANHLNNSEIKPRNGGLWRDAVVYHMLTNSIYKGERNFRGNKFSIEQIINTELFDNVQIKLSNNSHSQGINKKYTYLLDNQAVTCGVCGKSFFAHKRENNRDNVYKCISSRYSGERCLNSGVSITKLEKAVINLIRFDWQTNLIDAMLNDTDSENKLIELNNELSEIEGFIKKQDFKISNMMDYLIDGTMSKEMFKTKSEPINKEKTRLLNQAVNIKANIKAIEKQIAKINDLDFNINDGADDNDEIINKEVLRNIIQSITIYPSERHLTQISNDITVRVDVMVHSQVTQIFISNRTNKIEVVYPSGVVGEGYDIESKLPYKYE